MTASGGARRREIALAGGAIVLAALAAYANSFHGPLVLDDLSSVAGNPTIRHLWPLSGPLAPPRGGGLTVEGRPVLNLSLALNYAISGTRVWSYHAVNLAIHILAGLTLFGIVRRTLERWSALTPTRLSADGAAQRVGGNALHLAFFIALLWTVHPLQTESVTYVIQRAESLMGLFYLLTLYCFVRGAEMGGGGPAVAPRGGALAGKKPPGAAFWFGLSWLACLFGMGTKEVMVSAPVAVLLYDQVFLSGTLREAWRRHRGLYLGLAVTWIPLAWLVVRTGDRGGTSGWGAGVSAPAYWLTQFPAVMRYLHLAVWPHPQVFDYGTVGVGPAWVVLPEMLVVGGLAAGSAWFLFRPRLRQGFGGRSLGFLGFWFFAVLAPTSLIPGNRQTLAEHRVYLALAAVMVLAVWGIHRMAGKLGFALLTVLAIGFIVLTARRNRDYASELALYTDNVAQSPGNAFAQCNLGTALAALGREREAIDHFAEAVRLRPRYPIAEDNWGNALLRLDQVGAAEEHYETALHLNPDFAEAEDNLGTALLRQGRMAEAMAHYQAALRLDPGRAETRNNLGNTLAQQGRAAEAVTQYEAALALDPDYAEADNDLGNVLAQQGRWAEAVRRYGQALQLRPAYAEAHYDLGNAFLHSDRTAEAIGEFQQALGLRPDYLPAHENLGNALFRQGRMADAASQYETVVRLAPDQATARYNLGNAFLRLGRTADARAQLTEALRLQPDLSAARKLLGRLPP